ENLKKMFFAQAKDLRAVLIELSSRLDNLQTLRHIPKDQQPLYALENLKIFAPIAGRLSLRKIKARLEDLSFSFLLPEKSYKLESYIKENYKKRGKHLAAFSKKIKRILDKERIKVIEMNWRPKTYWSTYKKLLRHNMDIEKVHDLLALRIITDRVDSCYKILGLIHKYFKPLEKEIDDYIARPKENGYRSLHTTVFSESGQLVEVQIKTEEMHKEAEYGICSHWAYKEGVKLNMGDEEFRIAKQIPKILKDFKINFYEDKVFVFSPKGDLFILPENSTPIDFAYAVHSDIGNKCDSAKVNGKITPLYHPLKNGDIVEIATDKKRGPSLDWLNYVKTNLACSQIKKKLAERGMAYKIASIGKIPGFLKKKAIEISERITKPKKQYHLYIADQKDVSATIAKCCNPKIGDAVSAYISRYRAAVVHKNSCKNLQRLIKKSPEQVLPAAWRS
ncbi:TGS domain-containing protein, partial [Patescibacteria group bacterium]|nr:TGS domain-containing protein [Patescibacteria group bacterium]